MKHSSRTIRWLSAVLVTPLLPLTAHAHVAAGGTAGLSDGLFHPLTGIDHMAAMIAVGLWASQSGGRAVWAVPFSFVAVMSLSSLIERHVHYTNSARGKMILENWDSYLPKFTKVMPVDYKRALAEMEAEMKASKDKEHANG